MFRTSYAYLQIRPAMNAAASPAPRQTSQAAAGELPRLDKAPPPTLLDALAVDVNPDGAAGAYVRYRANASGAFTATARWDNGPAEPVPIDQPGHYAAVAAHEMGHQLGLAKGKGVDAGNHRSGAVSVMTVAEQENAMAAGRRFDTIPVDPEDIGWLRCRVHSADGRPL